MILGSPLGMGFLSSMPSVCLPGKVSSTGSFRQGTETMVQGEAPWALAAATSHRTLCPGGYTSQTGSAAFLSPVLLSDSPLASQEQAHWPPSVSFRRPQG